MEWDWKTAGSLAGWVSAIFLLLDRLYFKDRPAISFDSEPFVQGGQRYLKLVLQAPASGGIALRRLDTLGDGVHVWKTDDLEDALGGGFSCVLRAGETGRFPVVLHEERRLALVYVTWRSLRTPARPQIPIEVREAATT